MDEFGKAGFTPFPPAHVLSVPRLRRPADQQVFRAAGSGIVTCPSVPIMQVIPHVCIQLCERMLTYLS